MRAFLYALLLTLTGSEVDDLDLAGVAGFGDNERLVDYYRKYLPTPEAIRDRRQVATARPKVQSDIALANRGPVMMKTHNALMDYEGAPLINRSMSAGAVYVIRNPLDVAISLAHFRNESVDAAIDEMATPGWSTQSNDEDVYFVTGSWSEHVSSWTARPSDVILPVRYEDLLAAPLETFTALARHVWMPGTPEQIGRAVELAGFDRLQTAEARQGFLEKPENIDRFFREGRAGQWRETLSKAQVARVVADHGEQMARFGYLPTG